MYLQILQCLQLAKCYAQILKKSWYSNMFCSWVWHGFLYFYVNLFEKVFWVHGKGIQCCVHLYF